MFILSVGEEPPLKPPLTPPKEGDEELPHRSFLFCHFDDAGGEICIIMERFLVASLSSE
jgi:hypothetical protein